MFEKSKREPAVRMLALMLFQMCAFRLQCTSLRGTARMRDTHTHINTSQSFVPFPSQCLVQVLATRAATTQGFHIVGWRTRTAAWNIVKQYLFNSTSLHSWFPFNLFFAAVLSLHSLTMPLLFLFPCHRLLNKYLSCGAYCTNLHHVMLQRNDQGKM